MAQLTAENVHNILTYCLYTDEEIKQMPEGADSPEGALQVRGVLLNLGLHPHRVAEKKEQIREMLAELPDQFRADKGSGWSFLNACMDRSGAQWGEHINIDELLCLGQAAGLAKILMPREMWAMFPGGMPYFSVDVAPAEAGQ